MFEEEFGKLLTYVTLLFQRRKETRIFESLGHLDYFTKLVVG